VTDIQVSWLNRPEGTTPRCGGNNGREYSVEVTVDYQFRSVIPLVPIPPVVVRGASTLVINN
jgi:hypothetical protein